MFIKMCMSPQTWTLSTFMLIRNEWKKEKKTQNKLFIKKTTWKQPQVMKKTLICWFPRLHDNYNYNKCLGYKCYMLKQPLVYILSFHSMILSLFVSKQLIWHSSWDPGESIQLLFRLWPTYLFFLKFSGQNDHKHPVIGIKSTLYPIVSHLAPEWLDLTEFNRDILSVLHIIICNINTEMLHLNVVK